MLSGEIFPASDQIFLVSGEISPSKAINKKGGLFKQNSFGSPTDIKGEEAMKQAQQNCEDYPETHKEIDFEKEKRKILEKIGRI